MNLTTKRRQVDLQRTGLVFGALAGLGYGLALWGLNVWVFWNASAEAAWPVALAGILLSVGVGAFAGWLAARRDNAFLTFLIWLGVGVIFSWLALQTNFRWVNQAVELLHPELRGLHVFPLEHFISLFRWVLFIIIGLLTGMAGVFQLFLVESAINADMGLGKVFVIVLNVVLFAVVGMVTDYICQRPLREPVVGTADAIRILKLRLAETGSVEGSYARALKPLGDRIFGPYTIYSGTNDPNSIMTGTVHLDMNGEWAYCSTIEGNLGFCDLSDKIFAGRLQCLLQGGDAEACLIRVAEDFQEALQSARQAVGTPQAVSIFRQRGDAVLLDLQAQDGSPYRCVLRLRGNTYFEGCFILGE
jgi:hypothetical protein